MRSDFIELNKYYFTIEKQTTPHVQQNYISYIISIAFACMHEKHKYYFVYIEPKLI